MLPPGILMGLCLMFWGCRTVDVELGDRVRRAAPGDVVPELSAGARYWVLMDDVRFVEFLRKIEPGGVP